MSQWSHINCLKKNLQRLIQCMSLLKKNNRALDRHVLVSISFLHYSNRAGLPRRSLQGFRLLKWAPYSSFKDCHGNIQRKTAQNLANYRHHSILSKNNGGSKWMVSDSDLVVLSCYFTHYKKPSFQQAGQLCPSVFDTVYLLLLLRVVLLFGTQPLPHQCNNGDSWDIF